VLRVSRQAIHDTPKNPDHVPERRPLRLVARPLPIDWQSMVLSPAVIDMASALHVLARRHPAAGYRKLTSRLRRAGWLVNRKRIARLLRAWGLERRRSKRHPKAQGHPSTQPLQRVVADRPHQRVV
jgi:transposase InsO family protein